MARYARIAYLCALLPLIGTVAAHQAFAGAPATAVPNPFTIAAYEHVRASFIPGVEGAANLVATALLLAGGGLVFLCTAGPQGVRLRDAVGFGLLAGGGFANAIEISVRGSVLDWLWISLDGQASIATNVADVAMVAGALLLTGDLFRALLGGSSGQA
jgi:lipoprotein signal peptidase